MKLKIISVKFGLVCGMIITLAGAYDAVLGSISKTLELFDDKEDKKEVVEAVSYLEDQNGIYIVPDDWEALIEIEPAAGTPPEFPQSLAQEEAVPFGPQEFPEEAVGSAAPEMKTSWLYKYLIPGGLALIVGSWFAGRKRKKDEDPSTC